MRLGSKNYLLYTCLALPLSCLAGSMGNVESSKLWYIPVQGGFFGASQGTTQHINIDGLVGNRYTVDNGSQTSGLAGIGLFLNGYSQERLQLSYGLNLFYLGQTEVHGDIVQENLFTNVSYKYNIQNLPLYAAAKAIIYTDNPNWAFTVDAGAGPDFMWTSNYRERPLTNFAVPDNAFKGTSKTTFSATAGVGLRLNNFIASMPVECGYRLFYFAKGNLNITNNQYLDTLNTGDTWANSLVCSVII